MTTNSLEYMRAYRAAHRVHLAEYAREWYQSRPGNAAAKCKAYRERHPEAAAASSRGYRERNPNYAAGWRQKNADKVNDSIELRRARKFVTAAELVKLSVVFDRDNGICALCKGPVALGSKDRKAGPSLDHVIPLVKGGEHSYANIQLAHRSCNSAKGARLPVSSLTL